MAQLTVEAIVNNEREKVWEAYTNPKFITKWAHADDTWHAPRAENDLKEGGKFLTRMEAKDGSEGFDFTGVYDEVVAPERIAYTMSDGRKALVVFEELGNSTHVRVSFDPESENPHEFQIGGWQAILNNFKTLAESL
ncbi:SRPBCC domain-containing protein [bacterium]|nr:SRPBCC domain-containing protein [bacterium]